MNSFRFLERGIEDEIERQVALWSAGEAVVQETLHFDPVSGSLTPLRSKEEVHDYRYFPEPDLVTLARWTTGELVARLREQGLVDPRESKLSPRALAELVSLVESRALSQS